MLLLHKDMQAHRYSSIVYFDRHRQYPYMTRGLKLSYVVFQA